MKFSTRLIVLLSLIWTGSANLFAAEDDPKQPQDSTNAEAKVSDQDSRQSGKKNKTPVSSDDAKKKKTLEQAFEKFIPSEIISADNAVPFPVDI